MNPTEKFGEFLIRNFRDKAIEHYLMLQNGELRAKTVQSLQTDVVALPTECRDVLAKVVVRLLDAALHDLLFAFQDAHDRNWGIEVVVDGHNVAEDSGMLHGEPLGDEGWTQKFSRYADFARTNPK